MSVLSMMELLKRGATSQRVTLYRGADGQPLREGEWNTLCDLEGPGAISHLWFTFPLRDVGLGRRTLLRAYWDEEEEPSIEAPLTDFAGAPFGFVGNEFSLISHYLTVAPNNGFNCYFEMPFARRARLEILPEQLPSAGGFYFQADYYRFSQRLPEEYGDLRFHAQFRFENPCEQYGRNYLILDAAGEGVVLGATLGIEVPEESPDAWYHGGGDTLFIDGETRPSVLHGIGTEDFFGHSWGVRRFQAPNAGTAYHEVDEEGRERRIALYRFFVHDPIPFSSSFRGILGSLGQGISSVAYWYQAEPHQRFFAVPEAEQRMPGAQAPYGTYDIEPPGAADWLLLGPFRLDEANPFDLEQPFERQETGDEEFTYVDQEGTPTLPRGNEIHVKWIPQKACHNFLDFNVICRPATSCIRLQSGVVGYALRYIDLQAEQDVRVHVGFDDEVRVRVNDEIVFTGNHPCGFAEEGFTAHLRQGRNRILVKLSNYDNTTWKLWAFSFRM
ncbi:MAG: glycoside hydrolase family 172 protein [Anaerolineae bacterium]